MFCLVKLPVAQTDRNTSWNHQHLVTVFDSGPAHNCLVLPTVASVGISVEGTPAEEKFIPKGGLKPRVLNYWQPTRFLELSRGLPDSQVYFTPIWGRSSVIPIWDKKSPLQAPICCISSDPGVLFYHQSTSLSMAHGYPFSRCLKYLAEQSGIQELCHKATSATSLCAQLASPYIVITQLNISMFGELALDFSTTVIIKVQSCRYFQGSCLPFKPSSQ